MEDKAMKCACQRDGHHFHKCKECGENTAGYKHEKEWICYICIEERRTVKKTYHLVSISDPNKTQIELEADNIGDAYAEALEVLDYGITITGEVKE